MNIPRIACAGIGDSRTGAYVVACDKRSQEVPLTVKVQVSVSVLITGDHMKYRYRWSSSNVVGGTYRFQSVKMQVPMLVTAITRSAAAWLLVPIPVLVSMPVTVIPKVPVLQMLSVWCCVDTCVSIGAFFNTNTSFESRILDDSSIRLYRFEGIKKKKVKKCA